MTKKEMFAKIREMVINDVEMVEFIDHEIELLNRKTNREKKMTKTQLENEGFKKMIVEYLTENKEAKNIKELQTEIAELENLTNQKVTHLLTALVKDGILEKEYIKKTPFYKAI